jgi:hypothetical protein
MAQRWAQERLDEALALDAGFVEQLVQPPLTLVRLAARRSPWPPHPAPGRLVRQ